MRMISWVLSLGLLAAALPALAEEAAPPAQWSVARAVVTSGINEREPVDELNQVAGEMTQVYFFTELRGMQGQRVLHRWVHNDTVMAEVGFDVNGPRWRVWSSKNMMPEWAGTWMVNVVDANGEVLVSREFSYGQ
ncbi:DUF2914 domain-containing protein [Sulfurivermis fontis]|uniref:DUF2914 domain-containing protein n=1 Tax=Sulfurivermis fontis TaxID=1972068 RepID=UPI000FD84726|nr:DUF2914 domain-containing protein [Sulfurivermis fontis]